MEIFFPQTLSEWLPMLHLGYTLNSPWNSSVSVQMNNYNRYQTRATPVRVAAHVAARVIITGTLSTPYPPNSLPSPHPLPKTKQHNNNKHLNNNQISFLLF